MKCVNAFAPKSVAQLGSKIFAIACQFCPSNSPYQGDLEALAKIQNEAPFWLFCGFLWSLCCRELSDFVNKEIKVRQMRSGYR